jgi:hypothetical protein
LLLVKATKAVASKDYIDIPVPELARAMYSCSKQWQEAFIFTHDTKKVLYKSYFEGSYYRELVIK